MTKTKDTNKANATETFESEGYTKERPKRRKVYERPSATTIPQSVIDHFAADNYALRLVRWSIKGEPDYRYLNRREQEGYIYVTKDELPEAYAKQVRIRDTQVTKGLITNGGDLCLMKIDVELRQSRINFYNDEAAREQDAVDIHVLEKKGNLKNVGSSSKVMLREPSFQD